MVVGQEILSERAQGLAGNGYGWGSAISKRRDGTVELADRRRVLKSST